MFSNANLKPSKLDEHFKNRHGGRDAGNDIETLRVKKDKFDRAGTLPMYGFSPLQKPLLIKLPTLLLNQRSPIQLARN